MTPENAAYMTQMMQGTIADGTGTAAALAQYQAAGKTGTSQDYRDAWFIGYTADYVTGIWVGNDDGRAMRKATGGGLPARAFHNFMMAAERGHPPKPLPALAFFTPEDEAPAAQPDNTPAETAAPEQHDDVLKRFQNLLDRLF
jgi:penicillin-binding protein 1A